MTNFYPARTQSAWCRSTCALAAECAFAVTGRRCPHNGEGEDFLTCRPSFWMCQDLLDPCWRVSQSVINSCFWDFVKSWAYHQSMFRVCPECVQSVLRVYFHFITYRLKCVSFWHFFTKTAITRKDFSKVGDDPFL